MTITAACALTDDEIARFASSRIPLEVVAQHRIRHVLDAEGRERLVSRHHGSLEGLLYPFMDPETGHEVGYRLRRTHPEMEDGRPKDKWLSSPDRSHLYFPIGAARKLADPSVPVLFVEAAPSVLAVTCAAERLARSLLVIGTNGCHGWRGRRGKTVDAHGMRVDDVGPLPDLDRLVCRDREAFIGFDSNAASNPKVQAARRAFALELATREAVVRIFELPQEDGVNGPDDFLALHLTRRTSRCSMLPRTPRRSISSA